ncbi:helix-turn-helix domain-containing protein [Ligilactobacillus faecis]|uniref:helix-turn-helix domain-containing protein n=1 Tax=Ligilactobacillus faecis TaxID=762833 RepID=UPI002468F1C7|nr:helix-turn-helix transcriptional regulator [Ligilactobacillus faecis]WGN90461.1 helix-turn-helix transcriptional regulator [Ligilactobacillus faecis]
MRLGDKIKDRRLELRLTQDQVAQELYISRQTLSNWENNKTLPDIQSLISLSDLYGLSLDELIRNDKRLQKKIKIKDNFEDIVMYLGCIMVPISVIFLSGFLSILVSSAGVLCILLSKDIAENLKKLFTN